MRSRKYMCDDQTVARPATGQTPVRNLRVANDVWLPALAAARHSGATLTDVITQFLRWYLRLPGAKLPERPERRATEDE
jgi:hypothetical protein